MKNNSGQALLTVILISTVILTVGLSIAQLTSDETKTTELEDESKRAFAAAEAGLEEALQLTPGASVDISSLNLGTGVSGSASVDTSTSTSFTTTLLKKDAQYTFYLTGYNPDTKTVIQSAFADVIQINRTEPTGDIATYCASDPFAVELTFINVVGGITSRSIIDECNILTATLDKIAFGDSINTSSFAPPPHVLIARVISADTSFTGAKIEFVNTSSNNWPIQGKTVTSTAQTSAGVAKRVQLFQAYPQLPAEFFVTSF